MKTADMVDKEMADLLAQIATHDAAVLTLTTERDAAVKAVAEMKASADKAAADLVAASEQHAASLAEQTKALAAEKEQHAKVAADLEKARRALENPAFADAAVRGTQHPAPAGMPAGDPAFTSQAEALAAYHKIEGARERAEFRKQNKEILGL